MDYHRISHDTRVEAFQARAKTARRAARLVKLALTCAVASAIWIERDLAPAAHDRMKHMAQVAETWLEHTESTKSYLTAMSNFTPSGGGTSQYDPITDALLKLRH